MSKQARHPSTARPLSHVTVHKREFRKYPVRVIWFEHFIHNISIVINDTGVIHVVLGNIYVDLHNSRTHDCIHMQVLKLVDALKKK